MFLIIFLIKRDWVQKKKKLNFLRHFDNPLSKYLIFNFLHAMALGYLPKLKRGLGLAFGSHFPHDFSIKCSLFNTLFMDKVLMSYLPPSEDIK